MYKDGAGVILAGGQSSRMGGQDKSRVVLGGETCFHRVAERLFKHFSSNAVSVAAGFRGHSYAGMPIIRDPESIVGSGPAVAILSSLKWAAAQPGIKYIITSTVDTPFLPDTFVRELIDLYRSAESQNYPVYTTSNQRKHGLHALWPTCCIALLEALVMIRNERKINALHDSLSSQPLVFQGSDIDPFFNINTPEDLRIAERWLST